MNVRPHAPYVISDRGLEEGPQGGRATKAVDRQQEHA